MSVSDAPAHSPKSASTSGNRSSSQSGDSARLVQPWAAQQRPTPEMTNSWAPGQSVVELPFQVSTRTRAVNVRPVKSRGGRRGELEAHLLLGSGERDLEPDGARAERARRGIVQDGGYRAQVERRRHHRCRSSVRGRRRLAPSSLHRSSRCRRGSPRGRRPSRSAAARRRRPETPSPSRLTRVSTSSPPPRRPTVPGPSIHRPPLDPPDRLARVGATDGAGSCRGRAGCVTIGAS